MHLRSLGFAERRHNPLTERTQLLGKQVYSKGVGRRCAFGGKLNPLRDAENARRNLCNAR